MADMHRKHSGELHRPLPNPRPLRIGRRTQPKEPTMARFLLIGAAVFFLVVVSVILGLTVFSA